MDDDPTLRLSLRGLRDRNALKEREIALKYRDTSLKYGYPGAANYDIGDGRWEFSRQMVPSNIPFH
jgi:hypothetical protein